MIIIDEGVGVPDYAIDKIYDRFYSLNRLGKKLRGTGLGLSFVSEICRLHDGEIKLQNNPEKGCTAILTISLKLKPSS